MRTKKKILSMLALFTFGIFIHFKTKIKSTEKEQNIHFPHGNVVSKCRIRFKTEFQTKTNCFLLFVGISKDTRTFE